MIEKDLMQFNVVHIQFLRTNFNYKTFSNNNFLCTYIIKKLYILFPRLCRIYYLHAELLTYHTEILYFRSRIMSLLDCISTKRAIIISKINNISSNSYFIAVARHSLLRGVYKFIYDYRGQNKT